MPKRSRKALADQMRRLAPHLADAEIDAGLAEKDRLQLRMGVGQMQDARIAEAVEVVEARGVGGARDARSDGAGERRAPKV